MEETEHTGGFIPTHGGYRNLISYRKAEIIYDGTVYFTNRFFDKYDRTVGQMVHAARSGKQNIAEGSMASVTSIETEIKLTNVARARLDERKKSHNLKAGHRVPVVPRPASRTGPRETMKMSKPFQTVFPRATEEEERLFQLLKKAS